MKSVAQFGNILFTLDQECAIPYDRAFMLSHVLAANEISLNNVKLLHRYAQDTRNETTLENWYGPDERLAARNKSILSSVVGCKYSTVIIGLSPLETVACIEGIEHWFTVRRRLQATRNKRKKLLSALHAQAMEIASMPRPKRATSPTLEAVRTYLKNTRLTPQ